VGAELLVGRFARTTAVLALGACTFAACEEVSVRDKSKDQPAGKDAGPGIPKPAPVPTDEPAEPVCLAQGASGCTEALDCCTDDSQNVTVTCLPSRICALCKRANALCGSDDLCCSGRPCNTQTNTCPNECRSSGVACDNDGQCCDVTDPSAKFECRADKKCAKCLPTPSTCSTTAECCRGLKCSAAKKCALCIPQGATACSTNDDCCDGLVCATDVDAPLTTRCVPKCWPQWSSINVNTPCKNAPVFSETRPCCAPFKCNFLIPSSSSLGCGP